MREKCPYLELYWSIFSRIKNQKRYFVSLRIQYECRKIRTRITPNTDTFYAVFIWGKTYVGNHKSVLLILKTRNKCNSLNYESFRHIYLIRRVCDDAKYIQIAFPKVNCIIAELTERNFQTFSCLSFIFHFLKLEKTLFWVLPRYKKTSTTITLKQMLKLPWINARGFKDPFQI